MKICSFRDDPPKPRSATLCMLLLLVTAGMASDSFGPLGSYLVQAADHSAALNAVKHAHGRLTHDLPIINAVAADLTPSQLAALEHDSRLKISPNRMARVSATASANEVQPYVVERTNANLLHAQGITGRGVTIAFLDTGWWNQHATQTNVAGRNVVFQGYDAI